MSMPPARFRPMTVGDIVDEGIQLYRRQFKLFLAIGAIIILPVAILQILVTLATQNANFAVATLGSFLSSILSGLGTLAILGAMIHAASETWFGRPVTVREAFDRSLDRIWSTLGLVLLMIFALVPMLIVFPVAVYFGVCWVLALQVLHLERAGVTRSLGRSRQLVKGHWWRVFGILIVIAIIQFIISAFFAVPAAIFGAGSFLRDPTADISSSVAIVSTLGDAAGRIVAGPIGYCAWVLLYYDARVRKEGLDMDLALREMEKQLDAPARPVF